jgi:hypothetical protein
MLLLFTFNSRQFHLNFMELLFNVQFHDYPTSRAILNLFSIFLTHDQLWIYPCMLLLTFTFNFGQLNIKPQSCESLFYFHFMNIAHKVPFYKLFSLFLTHYQPQINVYSGIHLARKRITRKFG